MHTLVIYIAPVQFMFTRAIQSIKSTVKGGSSIAYRKRQTTLGSVVLVEGHSQCGVQRTIKFADP